MNNDFKFESRRLNFRLIQLKDLNNIHNLHSKQEVDKFLPLGIPKNIKETEKIVVPWIAEVEKKEFNSLTFAIEKQATEKFIGLFGIKLWYDELKKGEVWYKLHPTFWGKGYATEALKRMMEFGFKKLNLEIIQAGTAVKNLASIKVLEKAGMKRIRRGLKVLQLKNGWSDNFQYQLLKQEASILNIK